MTLTTILFDAGDILYTRPSRSSAMEKFLLDRGYDKPAKKDDAVIEKKLTAHAGEISGKDYFRWLMARHGVNDSKDLADGVELLETAQSNVIFFEGVADTIHELKRRGFLLGIVTNTFNPEEEKSGWFKQIGIDGVWDSYADSSVLKVVKPNPEIYMAALDPIGVSPENAAFVGHAQHELDGAKAIGMTTIMFNPYPDCKKADFRAKEFRDLLTIQPIAEAFSSVS